MTVTNSATPSSPNTADVAVVTGASTGIGRELVTTLAREGHEVIAIARSLDALEETRRLAGKAADLIKPFPLDLRSATDVVAGARQIEEQFGPVGLLANIAAVWHNNDRAYSGPLLHELATEEIIEVLDVGIQAPMLLSSIFGSSMSSQRRGHIVNLSGTFGEGGAGWLHYFVSKRALEQFTVGLAQELTPFGVQVNCVSPADVDTPAYRRFYPEYADDALQPSEVVEVIRWLIGHSARNVSGQIIEVRHS